LTPRELGLLVVILLQAAALVFLSLGTRWGQSTSRQPSKGWNFLYCESKTGLVL
jgi:hypothetical protein